MVEITMAQAVLGEDFSLSLGGQDDGADSSNAFDRSWKESCAWTIADGLMMDASLTGTHHLLACSFCGGYVTCLRRQPHNVCQPHRISGW